ncbi:MAG: aldo/keto reductase [Acidimicrobiales bacterium]
MIQPYDGGKLERKRVGTQGPEVSILSLGSWHTYDRIDFSDAVAMMRLAVDAGINLFDVGVYGVKTQAPVHTDVLFSAIMRGAEVSRDQYILSAKLWLEEYPSVSLREQLDGALFRVGTDHAELAILGDIHQNDLDTRQLVIDLGELHRDGLLGCWGVNNWSVSQIEGVKNDAEKEGVGGPQMAQLKYSVCRRAVADGEAFKPLFGGGLTLEASDVMEGGLLVGGAGRDLGEDQGPLGDRVLAAVPNLQSIAAKLDASPAQVCIAFTLTHPRTTTTLFGATGIAQLSENLGAVTLLQRVGAESLRALVDPLWADQGLVDPAGP